MANNTQSLKIEDNLAFHQEDKIGIFGYTNFIELKDNAATANKIHLIVSDETPAAITTYDLAPVGSLLFNTAGGDDTTLHVKEATGATGWAPVTTGAGA